MRKQDKDRNGKPEALLWVDVETTGVDRDLDELLEVGMRCTSVDATETYGTLTRLVKPQCLTFDDFTPVSFSMHCDSGLLYALVDSDPSRTNRKAVADAILEFLDSLAQRFALVPAGTNVDFDLDFLRRLDPDIVRRMSYWKLDVTTMRHLADWFVGENPYGRHSSHHRVRWCIERDISDYRSLYKSITGRTM